MNQSQLSGLDLSPVRVQVNDNARPSMPSIQPSGGPIITQPVQSNNQFYGQQPSSQTNQPAWSQPQQSRAVITPGPSMQTTVPVVNPVQNNQSFNNQSFNNQSYNNQSNYGNNNQSFNGPQPIKYANSPVRGPPIRECAFWMCCCESFCESAMVARIVCILDILFYLALHISPFIAGSGYTSSAYASSIGTFWIIMMIFGIIGIIFAIVVLVMVGNPTHGLKILGFYRWYRLGEMALIIIFGVTLLIWGFVLMGCSTADWACLLYKALGYFLVVYAIIYLLNLAWYVCLHKSIVNACNALAGIVTTTRTTTTNVMVHSPNASFQQQPGMY